MNNRLSYLIILLLFIFIGESCNESGDRIYTPAIAHTWKVKPIEVDETGAFISGPVETIWIAEKDKEILLGDQENGVTLADAATFITKYASVIISQSLKDVTFGEDYDIWATYSDQISFDPSDVVEPYWKESGKGYAVYKEISGKKKLIVLLDIDKITNGDEEIKSKINSIPILTDLISNGIPVPYETSTGMNNIRLRIDKDMVNRLLPLITTFVSSVKDEDFGGNGSYVRFLLGNIEEVMGITKQLDIILKMDKQTVTS